MLLAKNIIYCHGENLSRNSSYYNAGLELHANITLIQQLHSSVYPSN